MVAATLTLASGSTAPRPFASCPAELPISWDDEPPLKPAGRSRYFLCHRHATLDCVVLSAQFRSG